VTSPTQLTLKECKKRGWTAFICEKWNPHAKRRIDAFGFGDLLVIDPETKRIILIQTTTSGHLPDRMRKAAKIEAFETWLIAGGHVAFWGWSKKKRKTKSGAWTKKGFWTLREEWVAPLSATKWTRDAVQMVKHDSLEARLKSEKPSYFIATNPKYFSGDDDRSKLTQATTAQEVEDALSDGRDL